MGPDQCRAHAGPAHAHHFSIKQLEELDMRQAQLGLAHSFSRGKVALRSSLA